MQSMSASVMSCKLTRPTAVPMIELPDGTTIENSFEIALWLDRTYPDKPSLFTPSDPKPSQGAHDTAVALARILDVGTLFPRTCPSSR